MATHHQDHAVSLRNGTIQNQKEPPPKGTTAEIRIVMKSFGNQLLGNNLGGLPRYTRKIGLPEERVLYTVLRSPHIDKKSREQFEMEIHKQLLVIETETHELRKKFFWLKRQRLFGARYEIIFHYKTRSDRGRLLRSQVLARPFPEPEPGGDPH